MRWGYHSSYFRELDTRIARWWSTDPVTHSGMSSYNIFDANPIFYVDPSGADSDGPGDPTKEDIAKHKEKGEVWDTNVNTWVIGDVVVEAKQPQIMKDMKALGYTNRDRWEYAQMQRRSPNNPIVRNIQTRVAEGRYEPIYQGNSQYQDFGAWNDGIYSSDYAQGVSSVVGTTGTVAVIAVPGVAIAAGAMSRGAAKEVLDEVVDMAWESYTGTPSPFITGAADLAQAGVKKIGKKYLLDKGSFGELDEALEHNLKYGIDKEGWYTLILHGGRDKGYSIGDQYVGVGKVYQNMLRSGYKEGTPILSASCWSGINGAAKELSLMAKAPVIAPTGTIMFLGEGSMFGPPGTPMVFNNEGTRKYKIFGKSFYKSIYKR